MSSGPSEHDRIYYPEVQVFTCLPPSPSISLSPLLSVSVSPCLHLYHFVLPFPLPPSLAPSLSLALWLPVCSPSLHLPPLSPGGGGRVGLYFAPGHVSPSVDWLEIYLALVPCADGERDCLCNHRNLPSTRTRCVNSATTGN